MGLVCTKWLPIIVVCDICVCVYFFLTSEYLCCVRVFYLTSEY